MPTKKVLFLLGSANLSGGTYVILQHAQHLQKLGFQVTIALVFMTLAEYNVLKESEQCWHPALKELHFIHINEAKNFPVDVAIFTWWATLFSFAKINAASYVYFVQSIESRFYSKYENFMRDLVNRTYQLGLPVITEAQWIQHYLSTKYNSQCELVRNGILKSLYTPEGPTYAAKSTDQLRILVEGPVDVSFKNVARTIELCKQANVGEIWLLTSSSLSRYPGVTRVFSQVPISAVPAIYRSCDVLVKLSYVEGMFGPPLEMFHCGGTAIVYDVTGFDEYIVHDVNALVAKTDDEKTVIQYLKCLHSDRDLLARLTTGAKATAQQWIDWESSSNQFAEVLTKLATAPLTYEQKLSFSRQVVKHLHERIDVVTIKNNLRVPSQQEALPLYESGSYALAIPLTSGETQVNILFGKHYQHLLIKKVHLNGVNNSQPQGKINIALDQIVQNSSQIFECKSELSMLVIHVNVHDKNHIEAANFYLQVEFTPVVIKIAEEQLMTI